MFLTKGIETGNGDEYQLYNLTEDVSQENNLADKMPGKRDEMMERFLEIVGDGISKNKPFTF